MVGWQAVVMTEEPGLGPLEQAGRLNVRNRDEWAAVHGQDRYYDIAGFLAGASSLRTTELALSGDVAGLDLLHLQCHFGLDTLNWARRGARVTGLDFSGAPIGRAQALAEQAGLEASFVQADVLRLHASLFGGFDLVVGTYGVVLAAQTTVQWAHSLGEIVTALCRVGLCLPARKVPGGSRSSLRLWVVRVAIAPAPLRAAGRWWPPRCHRGGRGCRRAR